MKESKTIGKQSGPGLQERLKAAHDAQAVEGCRETEIPKFASRLAFVAESVFERVIELERRLALVCGPPPPTSPEQAREPSYLTALGGELFKITNTVEEARAHLDYLLSTLEL